MTLKVIIAGGRDFNNYDFLCRKVDHYLQNHDDVEVVCGGARGADNLGRDYAEDRDIPVSLFEADWNKLGKSAGYIRNKQMAEYADVLIAFWDESSKGTGHMINIMRELGKPVRIVKYGGSK